MLLSPTAVMEQLTETLTETTQEILERSIHELLEVVERDDPDVAFLEEFGF